MRLFLTGVLRVGTNAHAADIQAYTELGELSMTKCLLRGIFYRERLV